MAWWHKIIGNALYTLIPFSNNKCRNVKHNWNHYRERWRNKEVRHYWLAVRTASSFICPTELRCIHLKENYGMIEIVVKHRWKPTKPNLTQYFIVKQNLFAVFNRISSYFLFKFPYTSVQFSQAQLLFLPSIHAFVSLHSCSNVEVRFDNVQFSAVYFERSHSGTKQSTKGMSNIWISDE